MITAMKPGLTTLDRQVVWRPQQLLMLWVPIPIYLQHRTHQICSEIIFARIWAYVLDHWEVSDPRARDHQPLRESHASDLSTLKSREPRDRDQAHAILKNFLENHKGPLEDVVGEA